MTLEEAVKQWIRAEWQFRSGPEAFSGTTQEWFLQACDELRKTISGEVELDAAYREIQGKRKRVRLTPEAQRRLNDSLQRDRHHYR